MLQERNQKGPGKSTGADVLFPLDQARRFAAAPWREETAEALRRDLTAQALGRTFLGLCEKWLCFLQNYGMILLDNACERMKDYVSWFPCPV